MLNLHLVGEEIEAHVLKRASSSVGAQCLGCNVGIWKTPRKFQVRQRDGSSLGGYFVANTTCKVMDSTSVLGKFGMDTEGLVIGNKDVKSGLCWSTEKAFSMDA